MDDDLSSDWACYSRRSTICRYSRQTCPTLSGQPSRIPPHASLWNLSQLLVNLFTPFPCSLAVARIRLIVIVVIVVRRLLGVGAMILGRGRVALLWLLGKNFELAGALCSAAIRWTRRGVISNLSSRVPERRASSTSSAAQSLTAEVQP